MYEEENKKKTVVFRNDCFFEIKYLKKSFVCFSLSVH